MAAVGLLPFDEAEDDRDQTRNQDVPVAGEDVGCVDADLGRDRQGCSFFGMFFVNKSLPSVRLRMDLREAMYPRPE